jgi:AraC family ethanolamine operon transcriptional activator
MGQSIQPIQRLSYHFDDIDLLTAAMAEWDVQFLPLDPISSSHSINISSTSSVIIQQLFVGQRVHQQGATARGFVTFGFPSDLSGKMVFNNQQLNQSLVVFAGGQEYSSVSPTGFSGNSISIEKSTLASIAEQYEINLDIESIDDEEFVLSVSREDSDQIKTLLSLSVEQNSANPKLQRFYMEQELPLKLLSLIAANNSKHQNKTLASYNALALARNYIDSNAFNPIKISDICKASHAQERMLERAFKDYFELTPSGYLRLVRLGHARQALKNNEGATPISEIASNCGFSHLGRFAGYYRQQYNESPSDTLDTYQSNTNL